MSFMEAQITGLQPWLEIDGNEGIEWIPMGLLNHYECERIIGMKDAEAAQSAMLASFGEYFQSRRIFSMNIVHGWGVRSSAPGYMDCTDWTVYTDEKEADSAYEAECEECADDESDTD